ncbi:MAG TPA: hypothetical protein DCR48_10900 [Flavobacteriales bacterium]|nr:hypothetical protein [Flavobacteriales bacterium]
MKKKILIAISLIFVILGAGMFYLNNRNRTLSPSAEQRITTNDGLTVSIDYSRPSVRERLIFGTEEEGALQPFGVYWRLGANEATVANFSEDIIINGTTVSAGYYGIHAFPGKDSFDIALNKTWDRWGFSEPDYSQDIVNLTVPVEHLSQPIEQFTIRLGESNTGIQIICEWSDVRFVIPVEEK